jgi:transcription antitermination factor NusG
MPIGSESETANGLHWYAVWSRSRHEKMVASALSNAGITNFLPLVTETHRWSDRRKSVDVPLFPGYVFVQIPNSAEAQLQVRKMSGVVQFVGNQQGAVPIQDKEINDVRSGTGAESQLLSLPLSATGAAGENLRRRIRRHRGRPRRT